MDRISFEAIIKRGPRELACPFSSHAEDTSWLPRGEPLPDHANPCLRLPSRTVREEILFVYRLPSL